MGRGIVGKGRFPELVQAVNLVEDVERSDIGVLTEVPVCVVGEASGGGGVLARAEELGGRDGEVAWEREVIPNGVGKGAGFDSGPGDWVGGEEGAVELEGVGGCY